MLIINSKFFTVVFFLVIVGIVFVLLGSLWPIGPDYYYVFRPTIQAFIRGETHLYDAHSMGFYITPWSILILLPTTILPLPFGQSLLLVVSLIGLLVSVYAVLDKKNNRFNFIIVTLSLANLHTFDLLIRGNVDGILALGIGVGWLGVLRKNPWMLGIGLWLLSIKPVNIILTVPIFLVAAKYWPARDKIITIIPLSISLALSFPIFGFDWPIRYISFASRYPPFIYLQTSLWRALEFFGLQHNLAIWLFLIVVIIFGVTISLAKRVNRLSLALALSINLVFSPYTLGSHYILLAPALIVLSQESKFFMAIWFMTLTPILRLFWGFGMAWVDIIYPITLMFGLIFVILRNRGRANHLSQPIISVPQATQNNLSLESRIYSAPVAKLDQ